MLDNFQQFIQQKQLFHEKDRILLAISGGIDSTVLGHLLHESKVEFALVHCNFKLRGVESDLDEEFVKALAIKWNVAIYIKSFETNQIAKARKASIQLVARTLRYEWLEQIRQTHNYQCIATAHHLNDSLETVLYNFTKGTGIRGLHGILPKVGSIIRPLLFATKAEIEAYAKEQQISFREDASNATDKYARNKIRHHVIPTLKGINPNFEQTGQQTLENLQATEKLYDWAIAQFKRQLLSKTNDAISLNIEQLTNTPAPTTVLYECLKEYGFHADQCGQIIAALDHTGAQFYSASHQLLIDRTVLLIRPYQIAEAVPLIVNRQDEFVQVGKYQLQLNILDELPTQFKSNPNVAILDLDQLYFPLRLRHWQTGDVFCPIGMKGKRQKLQDFFSNLKLNRFEKEQVWLLESNGNICWVVGFRLDERFKITNTTRQALHLEWIVDEKTV